MLFFLVVLSLTCYQVVSTKNTGKSFQKLLSQLWLLLLESQLISGVGFVVLNVWRYNFNYFYFLKIYSIYSTFACLIAVLNTPNQKATAFGILAFAMVSEYVTKQLFVPEFVSKTT